MHSSWIEIDSTAFEHNIIQLITVLEKRGGSATKLGLVIKGNAYGHGLLEIVSIAKSNPAISFFFTDSLADAIVVRNQNVSQRICALVPADFEHLDKALNSSIEMVCCDAHFAQMVAQRAKYLQVTAQIHLKIDTGLHRFGIAPHETKDFCQLLSKHPELKLAGLMTHFANYDDLVLIEQQRTIFKKSCQIFKAVGFCGEIHGTSSGSIIFVEDDSLARIATSAYGLWKTPSQKDRFISCCGTYDLKPILTWKSRLMHIKEVPTDSGIGYNHTFRTKSPMRIGIIPVGYANGYPRALSNKGQVLVHQTLVPIVGLVSMNLFTVDLSTLPEAAVGDEVVLIGDHQGIRPTDLAELIGTTQLEILTNLKESLPRFVEKRNEVTENKTRPSFEQALLYKEQTNYSPPSWQND